MKLCMIQYDPVWESKEDNKAKLNRMLEESDPSDSLIIFPEMTLTGFTMKSDKFAEEEKGESFVYFSEMAKQYNADILAGIIERDGGRIYNSLYHIGRNGNLENKYRKIHPFSYSGEDRNYSRGEKTVITTINGIKTGLSICYDLRFPELYRQYAKEGVELIVNIANWPVRRIAHWNALVKARAIENQCYVAAVNRVGTDPGNDYNGFSSLISAMGEEIAVETGTEKVIAADIDSENVKEVRAKLPFLQDITLI